MENVVSVKTAAAIFIFLLLLASRNGGGVEYCIIRNEFFPLTCAKAVALF